MSLVSRFLRSKKQDLYVKKKYVVLSFCLKKLLFNHIVIEEANDFG